MGTLAAIRKDQLPEPPRDTTMKCFIPSFDKEIESIFKNYADKNPISFDYITGTQRHGVKFHIVCILETMFTPTLNQYDERKAKEIDTNRLTPENKKFCFNLFGKQQVYQSIQKQ